MLKGKKCIILIVIMASIGILLLILSSTDTNIDAAKSQEAIYKQYTVEIEEKIENFLVNIEGISKVEVIVMLDHSNESLGKNTDEYFVGTSVNTQSDTPYFPTVKGVAIACTNGDDYEIKVNITNIVSAYLGIPSNRIEIIAIK